MCLVFTLELYTNIHVPRGLDTYIPVDLTIYIHLPKGKGQRKGRPEKRRKTKITGKKDHGEPAKRAGLGEPARWRPRGTLKQVGQRKNRLNNAPQAALW